MQSPEVSFISPQGLDFLKLVADQEDACEALSRERLLGLGKKAPLCFEHLGTVLSLLDRVASCFWVCRGGDHLVEYLAGRVCSSARASLRLLLFGFFDESLSLTRSIGEVTNLLFLFSQDGTALTEWQGSTKRQRKDNFSPVKVRIRLESQAAPVLIDETRYSELCEVATHVTPQTRPQAHNPLGMPFAGSQFQEAGFIVALNELALATGLALISLPKILSYDETRRKEIKEAVLVLLDSIGGTNVLTVKDQLAEIRQNFHDALQESGEHSQIEPVTEGDR
jgi:hypothetical protein